MIASNTRGVVLAVDDEAPVRELTRRILESAGYGVIEAANADEALDVIHHGAHIDCLMLDLNMPGMRGEELARRIRAERPDLHVLYLTAQSDALFADRPELGDGEAFLDKPFSVKGLLEALSLVKNGYITAPTSKHALFAQLWHDACRKVAS